MSKAHAAAGFAAMGLIFVFWMATALSEVAGAYVVEVKTAIPWGLLALVPLLALAGGGGFAAARWRVGGLAAKKQKRMPFIAANGVLVLIPAALFLSAKAQAGAFDGWFYAVQTAELIAGAVNFTLLGLNARDGLRLRAMKARASALAT